MTRPVPASQPASSVARLLRPTQQQQWRLALDLPSTALEEPTPTVITGFVRSPVVEGVGVLGKVEEMEEKEEMKVMGKVEVKEVEYLVALMVALEKKGKVTELKG